MQCPIVLVSSGFDGSSIPLLMFSIGIYIYLLNLHAVIYFVHCTLSLIILFYICACCDTCYFKDVCLFLFVEVKALLGLCYMLYYNRHKITFLCLFLCLLCFAKYVDDHYNDVWIIGLGFSGRSDHWYKKRLSCYASSGTEAHGIGPKIGQIASFLLSFFVWLYLLSKYMIIIMMSASSGLAF